MDHEGRSRRLFGFMTGARFRHNRVKEMREALLISKAELARRAGLSPLTVDRIENGNICRIDTKRKIVLALGLALSESERIFPQG